MTEPRLEPLRIIELRAYAEEGVQVIDPVAVATAAMHARGHWVMATPRLRVVLVLVGLVLAMAVALGVVGGAPSPPPLPRLFTQLDLPPMNSMAVAAPLSDGRVLIVGSDPPAAGAGWPLHGPPAAWLWDPGTGRFTRTGAPTESRELPAVALLADGRVLVAGGSDTASTFTADGQGGGTWDERRSAKRSAEVYDPVTGRFTPTGPMTRTRGVALSRLLVRPTAVTLHDGRVLVVGGYPASGAEVFDPVTATFRAVGGAPVCTPDGHALAVRLADGRGLVRCGTTDGDGQLDVSDRLYDPDDDSVTPVEQSRLERADKSFNLGSADLLSDGRVLFTGATSRTVWGIWRDGAAELYDPVTGTYSSPVDDTNPQGTRASVTLPDGRVLLLTTDGPWLFDPGTGSFATLDVDPEDIGVAASAALLHDGRILVLRQDGDGVLRGGVIDPSAPAQLAPGRSAPAANASGIEGR